MRETILHEIAHAIAGQRAGHGAAWKEVCKRVGCEPTACDRTGAVMPRGRWRATCGGCGKEYHRHKRPAGNAKYWCRGCGPERGGIRFVVE